MLTGVGPDLLEERGKRSVCLYYTLQSEVCEDMVESAQPLGSMSYSSMYMFIVVY